MTGILGVLASNTERLFAASGESEQTLAKRGHTSAKNLNNARNGRNISLLTLRGVAKTFGYRSWELLVPKMDVDSARLQAAELVHAFDKAPPHIKRAVQVALGLRVPTEIEENSASEG